MREVETGGGISLSSLDRFAAWGQRACTHMEVHILAWYRGDWVRYLIAQPELIVIQLTAWLQTLVSCRTSC